MKTSGLDITNNNFYKIATQHLYTRFEKRVQIPDLWLTITLLETDSNKSLCTHILAKLHLFIKFIFV